MIDTLVKNADVVRFSSPMDERENLRTETARYLSHGCDYGGKPLLNHMLTRARELLDCLHTDQKYATVSQADKIAIRNFLGAVGRCTPQLEHMY